MIKLYQIGVKAGSDGEVRRHSDSFNDQLQESLLSFFLEVK